MLPAVDAVPAVIAEASDVEAASTVAFVFAFTLDAIPAIEAPRDDEARFVLLLTAVVIPDV